MRTLYVQYCCVILASLSEVDFASAASLIQTGLWGRDTEIVHFCLEERFFNCPLFPTASKKSKYEDVIDLNICADLSCLRIFIREKKHRIAEIHIEGKNKTGIVKAQNFVTRVISRFRMSFFFFFNPFKVWIAK